MFKYFKIFYFVNKVILLVITATGPIYNKKVLNSSTSIKIIDAQSISETPQHLFLKCVRFQKQFGIVAMDGSG